MATSDDFHEGQVVAYRAPHVPANEPGEDGVVTSTNSRWVFVRFGGSTTSAACSPDSLSTLPDWARDADA